MQLSCEKMYPGIGNNILISCLATGRRHFFLGQGPIILDMFTIILSCYYLYRKER